MLSYGQILSLFAPEMAFICNNCSKALVISKFFSHCCKIQCTVGNMLSNFYCSKLYPVLSFEEAFNLSHRDQVNFVTIFLVKSTRSLYSFISVSHYRITYSLILKYKRHIQDTKHTKNLLDVVSVF